MKNNYFTRNNKAQALIEFAIVLPILLILTYGLIEVGRLLFIYASVNNASRQAVRYGSTEGDNDSGVPRKQDCAGIIATAQKTDFLNAFEDADVTIIYDDGVNQIGTCDGVYDPPGNARVTVSIDAEFNPLFPGIVPFTSRPITTTSSRTLLGLVEIEPEKEEPTVSVTFNPEPSEVGELTTITVTVSGTTDTPTGTLTINGTDTNCSGTLDGSGAYSCTTTYTFSGQKAITYAYGGDDLYQSKTDIVYHDVNPATTTPTVSTSPNPTLTNASTTVTVTVTGGMTLPNGTALVTANDGTSCSAAVTITNGSGTCTITFTSAGTKTLTADFTSGDVTLHANSTGNGTHSVVLPGATVTTIYNTSSDATGVGKTVTLFVRVSGVGATPTGTVNVVDVNDGTKTCSLTLSNETATTAIGSCQITYTTAGTKTFKATYGGDTNNLGSSSNNTNHTIPKIPTTITITPTSPDPTNSGVAVTVQVTVVGLNAIPTGTVTISGASANPSDCTITLAASGSPFTATGSCQVTFNTSGSKTIAAQYNGDSVHNTSSDTEPHTVSAALANCNSTYIYTNSDVGDAYGTFTKLDDTLYVNINNTLGANTVQIGTVLIQWNHDRGAQGNKDLYLTSATLGGTQFWPASGTVTQTGPNYTITPPATTYLPAGLSTLVFKFHENYKTLDNTEYMKIAFSTFGCESLFIEADNDGAAPAPAIQ